jgi:DNA-binding SARP family transcriptional activator/tetratricopeptide (TPR) repeat protein/TolB-like protein
MLLLHTLGELRLEGSTARLSSRRKELTLLTYLARRAPKPVGREELAELLWSERDSAKSRQSLRQALLELKRLTGDGLDTESDRVSLAKGSVTLDATAFESDLTAGRWDEAVGRWRGEFLTGLDDMGGEEFRIWLESEREGLRRGLRLALLRLIEEARRSGAWKQAIGWAERWVELLPREEEGHRHLIELTHLDGRTAQALAHHAAFRSQLRSTDAAPGLAFEQLGLLLERHASKTVGHDAAGSAALFTPDLVGRGPILAELFAAWNRARHGSSESVLVEGESGIGKSRLCEEFLRSVERESGRTVGVRALAREGARPDGSGVLSQLLAGLAAAPGLAGTPATALAVLARVAPAIKARFPTLPEPVVSPSLVDAFREAIAAVAEEETTVLFVDDLPQIDLPSREALLALVERPPAGVLLIATARTGEDEPPLSFPAPPQIRRVKLQPLSPAEVELLVGSILELTPEDRRHLSARLHAHGGGSPFYIIELISALADEGTLAPTGQGVWRLTARDSRLPLPTSIRDLITRRLGRLTPPARSILESAAVLGIPFDRELLTEVSGKSPVAVDAAMEELLPHRLIRETGAPGCYDFAHELVRRHLDRSLPVARGEELSSRAIRALERRATDEPVVSTALAHHRARASGVTAAVRRRNRRRVLIAAGGATLAAVVIAWGLRANAGHSVSASAVAVLPFTVSGSPELGYLREGMVTLLSTELDGVETLRITDPRAVLGMAAQVGSSVPNVEQGRRVAERLGAGTYIIGDIVEAGGRVRINATAYREGRPARLVARAGVEGTTSDLFALVDGVARRLLTGLSPGPYEQLTRVAASTTSSLPALKAYLDGERLFRGGAFQPAVRAFQRATTEDTTFALAYYWLSVASWWADDSQSIDSAAARAVQFGGRLSDRDRRLFQAWNAFLKGDAVNAELVYRQVVDLEPENVEAWLQLGEVLFHSGPRRGLPMSAARKAFERVLYFEPEHTSALLHLARIAASAGNTADLDSLARRILRLNPSGEWAVEVKALRSFAEGDLAEQRQVIAELKTSVEGRVWNTARYVAVGAQDLAGARRLVALLAEPTRPTEVRAFGHLALAHLELTRGRLRAAQAELDTAAVLDPLPALEQRALLALVPFVFVERGQLLALRDSITHVSAPTLVARLETSHLANLHDGVHPELQAYLAAGLSIRAGDTAAALALAQELERPRGSPEATTVAQDGAASIRARVALGGGRMAEAARMLGEVLRLEARVGFIGGSPFYSQGLERFLYATVAENQGQPDEALRWYSSFASNSIFDLIYLAPSHIRRGRILERLGRQKDAAEHYRLALKLYDESDPEFRPLVREAQDGLARVAAASATR